MGYFQNPPGPSHDNFTASLQSMAIVANGDVHPAISSGQFVYVREHSTLSEGLYKASSSIAQDATLSTSNLTAVSGGVMNSLNEQMANISAQIATNNFTATNVATKISGTIYGTKTGHVVMLSVVNVIPSSAISSDTKIATVPYAPTFQAFGVCKDISNNDVLVFVNTSGDVYIAGITGAISGKNIYGALTYTTAS